MRIGLVIALFFPVVVLSQQLTATWSKKNMQIGEHAELVLRLKKAPKKVVYQPFAQAIPCEMRIDSSSLTQKASLELLENFSDTFYTRSGADYWEGRYKVTAWDTGVFILPEISLALQDTTLSVQPADITVGFKKKAMADGLDEVFEEYPEDGWLWLKNYWWLIFIPVIALIIILIRRSYEVKTVKTTSLKQRTQAALAALKQEEYWKKDKIDLHYMEFSFLVRQFLSARYGLNLMEKTTYESLQLLKNSSIPADALKRIRELLILSDMVKFAQGIPDEEETERGIQRFEELIVELSPLELAP